MIHKPSHGPSRLAFNSSNPVRRSLPFFARYTLPVQLPITYVGTTPRCDVTEYKERMHGQRGGGQSTRCRSEKAVRGLRICTTWSAVEIRTCPPFLTRVLIGPCFYVCSLSSSPGPSGLPHSFYFQVFPFFSPGVFRSAHRRKSSATHLRPLTPSPPHVYARFDM